MRLLIQNGRVAFPVTGGVVLQDVLLEDGKIVLMERGIQAMADQVIQASGLVVCPGLVDMHVHLFDPGFPEREDILSGAEAALRGGVTSLACMADNDPPTDSPERVRYIRQRAGEGCGVRIYPVGAVSRDLQGKDPTDAAALKEAGVVALSDAGKTVANTNMLRDVMIRSRRLDLPVLSHCEERTLSAGRSINEGSVSRQLWLEGKPAIAEELMVMRDAMLAEETGAHVHICHVSTAKSVNIIRQMKMRGVKITCETSPQYFCLTEDEVIRKGTVARTSPPLRTAKDVAAVIEGLQDGTIDVISSGHTPCSAEERARPLDRAPGGISGLETSLAASVTALYHTGKMEIDAILRRMTANPADILHLSSGRMALGARADLTIFDPDEEWLVDPDLFASRSHSTPFAGESLKGKVKYTIVGGRILYRDR